jgi:ribosome modulation factor
MIIDDDPYGEGSEAYHSYKSRDDCPYTKVGSRRFIAWHDGYTSAGYRGLAPQGPRPEVPVSP